MWPKMIILLPLFLASDVTANTDLTIATAPPSSTPQNCNFDGKTYATGEMLEVSCLILVCVEGTWHPTKDINNTCSMCSLRNDPHITGFYGWAYDFHGILEYYIAMNIDTYGVTGDFYQCNGLASCLDIITYKDDADTVITFDKDNANTILVNGDPFLVTNVVQNVETADNVAHPVLAWKQGGCIRIVGTRGIAVSFCIHDMYVWARNTILGDLNGLCFGGREFGAGRTGGKFKKLPVSQERIDKWGESLRVSGNITLPTYETTTAASNPIICDGETKLGLLLQCQDLFTDVTYDGTPVSDDLYQVSVDFCTFDLCAMTLSLATQEAIDNWKIIMIGMLANTIEIIVHTLPIEAPTTVAPGYCTFDGKIYANGEEFENSCLILVCERDTWRPTGRINSACSMCSIRNDPHFIDFFAWAFDFHGINNYAIAKNADSSGVTGEFYECYPFISCLDIITYKDDAATVVTFDRNGGNTILVNGSPFVVTNAVQNVESAGGVAHPVLAWKHNANCISIVGTRGIAVGFCGWEMYVWAQNAILGGLEGLCLAGPAFELANPPSDFSILRVPQEEIDAWGESLRVSGSHAARNVRSSDIKSNCDEATEEELLQVCLALLRGASYNGYPASHALLQVIAQFCKVDLCAMTLANATQEAIDNWKAVMVDMLENSIEVIVSSLPPGHPQDPEEEHGGRDSIDIKIQVLQEVNL